MYFDKKSDNLEILRRISQSMNAKHAGAVIVSGQMSLHVMGVVSVAVSDVLGRIAVLGVRMEDSPPAKPINGFITTPVFGRIYLPPDAEAWHEEKDGDKFGFVQEVFTGLTAMPMILSGADDVAAVAALAKAMLGRSFPSPDQVRIMTGFYSVPENLGTSVKGTFALSALAADMNAARKIAEKCENEFQDDAERTLCFMGDIITTEPMPVLLHFIGGEMVLGVIGLPGSVRTLEDMDVWESDFLEAMKAGVATHGHGNPF